jgi:hypothetical protein
MTLFTCILPGVHYRREVYEEGISHGLDDRAVVFAYCLLNDAIMDLQQAQHAGFVRTHLAAKADDVREHNGGQPPRLCWPRAGTVLWHGGIIGHVACGCQRVPAQRFPCPREPEGVKRQHALRKLWHGES